MKYLVHVMVFAALATGVSACGHKGKLKTPSQVELEEQKKARKEAKKEAEAKKAAENKEQQTPENGQKE